MPDLDLIKQGNQGCGWFGEADPSISAGRRRLQPTRAILLLIFCRSSKRPDGSSTNGCSPPRLPGVGPTTIQILPGYLVVGDTAEARQKRVLLDSLAHPDSGIASLSIAFGDDASGFDLDGPLPEIPESNASKSGRERFIECARRDNLTVRQLAQIAGSYGGLALVGRPAMIADQMEEWLHSEACDGFNIMSRMSGRPRRFRRPRRPRTPAPRPLPPRIRGKFCAKVSACRALRTASSAGQKASRGACFRSPVSRARVRAAPRRALLWCARNEPDFPSLGSRPRRAGASCGVG
jgi:hypothetical protein